MCVYNYFLEIKSSINDYDNIKVILNVKHDAEMSVGSQLDKSCKKQLPSFTP